MDTNALTDTPQPDPNTPDETTAPGHVSEVDITATKVVRDSLVAYGSSLEGVRLAHRDSHASIGTGPRVRAAREEMLDTILAPGATRCSGAGDRLISEPPDPYRTAFECDLDRIRHSKPFRRLAGKTQVFIAAPNEHLRNRLTHAIEVSQVAGAIARALGLNIELTEAMALGHDCGHGPTGHASEEAFAPYLPGDGYDHAVWGADVILRPLNLCAETLDGIRNHSWRRPAPKTPEGEVVSISDRLAYCAHDYDDAVRAKLITPEDLPQSVREVLGVTQGEQIAAMVHSVLDCVQRTGRIGLTEEVASALDEFRKFNYERIYLRPSSRRQAEKAIVMLRNLVERYIDEPQLLERPDLQAGSEQAARAAVEWVAGMTDRYAMVAAQELCDWDPTLLPRGV